MTIKMTQMKILMSIFALIVLDIVDGKKVSKLNDTDGAANDAFGFAVAINRNAIVVGSYLDDVNDKVNAGSINVLSIDGKLKKKITAPPGLEEMGDKSNINDRFGSSVALNTKYIVVGDIQDAPSPNFLANQGSVFIYNYVDNKNDWAHQQKIVAADGTLGDQFGVSVAINELNDVVVGTPYNDNDGTKQGSNQGAAYVFSIGGGKWKQKQKLIPSGKTDRAEFGKSVAITDSHIAVGAHYLNYRDIIESGGAYIYKKNTANGKWEKPKRLVSPSPKIRGRFGCAVSIYGKRVVVGAYGEGEKANTGKAYVFVNKVGNGWQQEAVLIANDGKEGDKFGFSVSMYEHAIIIGAPRNDNRGQFVGKGSAYLFELINGTTWTLSSNKFVPDDSRDRDSFGFSVGIFPPGNAKLANAVVGSPGGYVHGSDSGAAYLYNGLNFNSKFSAPKDQPPTSDSNKIACQALYVYLFVYFVYLFV